MSSFSPEPIELESTDKSVYRKIYLKTLSGVTTEIDIPQECTKRELLGHVRRHLGFRGFFRIFCKPSDMKAPITCSCYSGEEDDETDEELDLTLEELGISAEHWTVEKPGLFLFRLRSGSKSGCLLADVTRISLDECNFSLPDFWKTDIVRLESEDVKARPLSQFEIEFVSKHDRNNFSLLRELLVILRELSTEDQTLLASIGGFESVRPHEIGTEVSGAVERNEQTRTLRFVPTCPLAPASTFLFIVTNNREHEHRNMQIICQFMSSGEE